MRLSKGQLKCVKHVANNRGIKLQQLLDLGYNQRMIDYIIHKEQAMSMTDGRLYSHTSAHLSFKLQDKKFIVDQLPYMTLIELWGALHRHSKESASMPFKGSHEAQRILDQIVKMENATLELAS